MKLLTLIRLSLQGKSHLQCVFTNIIISPVCCDKQLNSGVKKPLIFEENQFTVWDKQCIIIGKPIIIGKHIMTFDLAVTIACTFMRGAKQTELLENLRRREILHLMSVCPPGVCVGGGGTLFSYIR